VVPALERCYLIPGDSPLGYRLPLDLQPAKSDHPTSTARPRNGPGPLASHADYRAAASGEAGARPDAGARPGSRPGPPWEKPSDTARLQGVGRLDHPPGHVRRAARRQALHLHAAAKLEDYLEVVAAVEATAEEMRCR
jgi:uncharacterized protein (DUF2126 family)